VLQNGVDNLRTKQERFTKMKRSDPEDDDDDEEQDIFQKIIGMWNL